MIPPRMKLECEWDIFPVASPHNIWNLMVRWHYNFFPSIFSFCFWLQLKLKLLFVYSLMIESSLFFISPIAEAVAHHLFPCKICCLFTSGFVLCLPLEKTLLFIIGQQSAVTKKQFCHFPRQAILLLIEFFSELNFYVHLTAAQTDTDNWRSYKWGLYYCNFCVYITFILVQFW